MPQVTLVPLTETLVTVLDVLPGLAHVKPVDNAAISTTFLPTHGTSDILPVDPMKIRTATLGDHSVHLEKCLAVVQSCS